MTDTIASDEKCWFVQTKAPDSYWTITRSFSNADSAQKYADHLRANNKAANSTNLRLRSASQWHQDDLHLRITDVATSYAHSTIEIVRQRNRDIIAECLKSRSFDYDDLAFYFACADLIPARYLDQPDVFVRLAYEISQAADRLSPTQIRTLSKAFASLALDVLEFNFTQADTNEHVDAVKDWIPKRLFSAKA